MFRSSIFVLVVLFSGAAVAQDLNYTYIQATYDDVDVDALNVDGSGIGIDLSIGITDEFYLFGNYQGASLDLNIDLTRFSAGVGFNAEVGSNLDMIAELAWVYAEADAPGPGGSADDNGIGARVGVRGVVSTAVELQGALRYDDLSEEISYDAGVLFNFTEMFAIGVFGVWEDEITTYRAGVRFNF